MLTAVRHTLTARSAALLATIESGLPRLMRLWLVLLTAACALRIQTSPIDGAPALPTLLSYVLLAAAPVGSALLAFRLFGQPTGRASQRSSPGWRQLSLAEARRQPLYGPSGLMVSLLLGLAVAIPLRAADYLAALPALSDEVPSWLATMQLVMTFDVLLFTSLYAVAFVAALRCVPLFPALLSAIWGADLAMQLAMAEVLAGQPGLPGAVGAALAQWIDGNVIKLLIGVALWLPYLLLSRRVNLTYRYRVPAAPVQY